MFKISKFKLYLIYGKDHYRYYSFVTKLYLNPIHKSCKGSCWFNISYAIYFTTLSNILCKQKIHFKTTFRKMYAQCMKHFSRQFSHNYVIIFMKTPSTKTWSQQSFVFMQEQLWLFVHCISYERHTTEDISVSLLLMSGQDCKNISWINLLWPWQNFRWQGRR